MPLKGKVGIHTQDNMRHAQNSPEDQKTVIALLNSISVAEGGAGGALKPPVKDGVCSAELYRAITNFENKHFPGRRRGYVDPGGAALAKLEAMAKPKSAPAPAPAKPEPACESVTPPGFVEFSPRLAPIIYAALKELGSVWPTKARCLARSEIETAQPVFGNSLIYENIRITDGEGEDADPFTFAFPRNGRWFVFINMGKKHYDNPNSDKSTLIHELVHAWQSQHHTDPMKFMWNCVGSQAQAKLASVAAAVNSSDWFQIASRIPGGGGIPDFKLGEADAYSWVPNKYFGGYAGEQIAQIVEKYTSCAACLSGPARATAEPIVKYLKSVGPGIADPMNMVSLSTIRYEHKNMPGVVWRPH